MSKMKETLHNDSVLEGLEFPNINMHVDAAEASKIYNSWRETQNEQLRSFMKDVKPKKLGGTKHDGDKPDLSLVPRSMLNAVARALGYGAKKYGRNNYKKGIENHRIVAAALRHLTAWNEGEERDRESGLSHLDHAGACIAMLCELNKGDR